MTEHQAFTRWRDDYAERTGHPPQVRDAWCAALRFAQQARLDARQAFEARMRARGYALVALTWLDSGVYLSPAVQREWEVEQRRLSQPEG